MNRRNSVGVVIGRFQLPELHVGHRRLIEYVMERHELVLILIGFNTVRFTEVNPYPVAMRATMLQAQYPSVLVQALPDSPVGHEHWSATVDAQVQAVAGNRGAVLYGSRDSFIPKYSGCFATSEVPAVPNVSGTALRAGVISASSGDVSFRQGWLAALQSQYPVTDPTVDVAIHTVDWQHVLLGRRGAGAPLRFIGGFVDPTDGSYEAAALREQAEEVCGVTVGAPVYVGSRRINDPRYERSQYGIMTTLFALQYQSGTPKPGDDIWSVEWVSISPSLKEAITPTHHDLFSLLLQHRERSKAR